MLDLFTIISRGGIVLWYFQRAADINVLQPVNSLIKSVILQERSGSHIFAAQKLHFKLDNEFELIFVVAYQKMLQLAYVDKLLDQVMLSFRNLYRSQLLQNKLIAKYEFSDKFSEILRLCEDEMKQIQEAPRKMQTWEQSLKSKKTVESFKKQPVAANATINKKAGKDKTKDNVAASANQDSEKENDPNTTADRVMPGKQTKVEDVLTNGVGGELSEESIKQNLARLKAMKMGSQSKKSKDTVANKGQSGKNKGKDARVWPCGGNKMDEISLDYSKPRTSVAPPNAGDSSADASMHLNGDMSYDNSSTTMSSANVTVGSMKGQLKGLETEDVDSYSDFESEEEGEHHPPIQPGGDNKPTKMTNGTVQPSGRGFGKGIFGIFKGLVVGKTLNAETLEGPLDKMREHLISKNVAAEVAEQLCQSVALKLEGKTVGSFNTIASCVRSAMEESLTTILSPKQKIDMLRDAQERKRSLASDARPYVVVFCGVNGVGKSTNLAKICFWLIENGLRVLVAGCDTFRSGAVEQLKTHCRALNALHPAQNGNAMVQLYEKGYGKDAAIIAKEAINYGKHTKFDVVLIDTAGRMQDNEPLMTALAKLISVNSPDLVLFVGEALVGNEATDQLLKFNRALADNAPGGSANPRCIDAIVLTKFDTIDDKVGACVSMTHSTGQPILFVGTGQTYTDLKVLNVGAVVNALLRA